MWALFWKVLDSFCLHSLVADVKMHHLPLSTGSNVWIDTLSVIGPEIGRGTLLWLFYFKMTEWATGALPQIPWVSKGVELEKKGLVLN